MSGLQVPPSCYVGPNVTGIVISAGYECSAGFFCPNTTETEAQSLPQVCPPDVKCQLLRLANTPCKPQGEYEPIVCMPGNYCPDFSTMLPCPSGSFCPTGSVKPLQCPPLSSCPAGAKKVLFYGGLIFCVIVDVALAFLYFLLIMHRRKLLKMNEISSQFDEVDLKTPDAAPESAEVVEDAKDTKADISPELIAGYSKAFGKLFKDDKTGLHLDFEFQNLGLVLPNGKQILNGVSGQIKSKKLTAIMGASGAGKTTFMNVLMGKVQRTYGQLLINGKQLEIHEFKKIVGYVPQNDIMIQEMTVRETIRYSAGVRLPSSWSNSEIDQYVDAVIETLGLSHVQHSFIGDETTRGISNGQRKRVNIGMELAASPLAIFADEPTSGLDSTAALKVANLLKSIAQIGVTVVAVLHQPRYEIFQQFDEILLIAGGGRTVYIGPQVEVVEYFKSLGFVFDEKQNPADVLMDIISGKGVNTVETLTVDDLVEKWKQHEIASGKVVETAQNPTNTRPLKSFKLKNNSVWPCLPTGSLARSNGAVPSESMAMLDQLTSVRTSAGWFQQALLAHNRSLIQFSRKVSSMILEIGVCILAGGLMGLSVMGADGEMFRGIYVSPYTLVSPAPLVWIIPLLGLLVSMAVGLSGAPAAVKIFGEEKVVYWREAAAGHSRSAYYVGKSISALYRFAVTSLHFTAVFYFLASPLNSFANMYGIIVVLYYCVYGFSAIVSMLVQRENASLLAVVACLFAAVFNYFGPTKEKAVQWGVNFIWEISYAKWASEALFDGEVSNFGNVYQVELAASLYGYTLNRFTFDLCMALLIGSVFRVIAYVLMIVMNRDKQK
ncbi:hypothetical protein MP228_000106 [Amoeboaphelidium protococcarum]|nr:hypothetical protein MP228_000106 [Amoeboaphelidium protococcarum]